MVSTIPIRKVRQTPPPVPNKIKTNGRFETIVTLLSPTLPYPSLASWKAPPGNRRTAQDHPGVFSFVFRSPESARGSAPSYSHRQLIPSTGYPDRKSHLPPAPHPSRQNPRIRPSTLPMLPNVQKFGWGDYFTPPPRANNLSEKSPGSKNICDRLKWRKEVGGYMRGASESMKKDESLK